MFFFSSRTAERTFSFKILRVQILTCDVKAISMGGRGLLASDMRFRV